MSRRRLAACLGAGALVAFALPPWGWWPFAFVGVALFDHLIDGAPRRARFRAGLVFGFGWLAPGMAWMWFLTPPGYVVAALLFSVFTGLGAMVVPATGRWRPWALAAAIAVMETVRARFPFGGVPLATLSMTQVDTALGPIARIGTATAVSASVVLVAGAVRRVITACWRDGVALVGAVAALMVLAAVAPSGEMVDQIDVAIVQGGGPQGTRAIDGGSAEKRRVFERHLAATDDVPDGMDLVVWPENVVNVQGAFITSPERAELAELARSLGTVLTVGIVEDPPEIQPDEGAGKFLNAQVVFDAEGTEISRYDKVRRVPFGEYIPFRSFIRRITTAIDAVPKDAVAGTESAVVDTPLGRLGVVISWEVFFSDRARSAVGTGGLVVINPTNGSSYTWTILQTQQIASSRLRALETGRWVLQAAPTGFSAFVTPDGKVLHRTGVSERKVITETIELRDGRTWAVRFGPWPVFLAALAVLVAAWRLQLDPHRRRAVVDQLDGHGGPESPGADRGSEGT